MRLYLERVEQAVENGPELEHLKAEIDGNEEIRAGDRELLVGRCERYLDGLRLEREALALVALEELVDADLLGEGVDADT